MSPQVDMPPQIDDMPPQVDYDFLGVEVRVLVEGVGTGVEIGDTGSFFTEKGVVRLRGGSFGLDAADNPVALPDAFSFSVSLVGDPFKGNQVVGDPWIYRKLLPGHIEDNPALTGNVTWEGYLLGFTPDKEPVSGNTSINIDIGVLAGRVDFTDLTYWAVGAELAPDTGNTWGDSNLSYMIEVADGRFASIFQYFHETGGDEGDLIVNFAGANHEGVVGTLKRDDLKAAFGAIR